MVIKRNIYTCLFLFMFGLSYGYLGKLRDDDCFCQLQGKIDDCNCNVDTVDHFNNIKIYPRLRSLLRKDYFRFYKVNLKRLCPFWSDDNRCAMRYCHVKTCQEDDIPIGLKGNTVPKDIYSNDNCDDHDVKLGFINTTISPEDQQNIILWTAYEDAQENFCLMEDHEKESEYVDLFLNPERFTGYRGKSAHKIWNSIYMENCFRPINAVNSYIQTTKLNNMCLEERVFYRAISGFHSSINIHLCAKYLLSETSLTDTSGNWGPNLNEFRRRFSKETTNGEGPHWLRNLYFVYLLELRALSKAAPYLQREEFYTGNEVEDWDTQLAVKDLLNVVQQFPDHFHEKAMFTANPQNEKLKFEFKQHFRNVSKIMDCVGCDKCKLWGKLQIQGLGTALKILFSVKFDSISVDKKNLQLSRNEIVALVNSIGRLSTSIYELDEFRHMIK